MMKLFKQIIFMVFFFMFLFINSVNALECSYTEQANLNKIASYVKVAYEITKDENGTEAIEISVYNITEDIYVSGTNDFNKDIVGIQYSSTDQGVYKFYDYNIDEIINYKFTVYSIVENCSGTLRNISFVKPMKNKFASTDNCKYSGMQDYAYCKEWITSKFSYQDWQIEEKILEKKNGLRESYVVNKREEKEQDQENKENTFLKNKLIVIIALIIAIIINIIVIGLLIERVRRYNI